MVPVYEIVRVNSDFDIGSPPSAWRGIPALTIRHYLFGLFRRIYGRDVRPGQRAAGNFYKCGDETEFPHYGAWSPVRTLSPDFHRPEFFGTLVFGRRYGTGGAGLPRKNGIMRP